jgi:hypothetical protein
MEAPRGQARKTRQLCERQDRGRTGFKKACGSRIRLRNQLEFPQQKLPDRRHQGCRRKAVQGGGNGMQKTETLYYSGWRLYP